MIEMLESPLQTYGVEIEMYHITRREAAYTVAKALTAATGSSHDVCYTGCGCYDCRKIVSADYAWTGDWLVERDGSIVAARDSERVELVTPVLRWRDMPVLQEVIRALRRAGARSDPAHSCGIHVHVGGSGMTARTLLNLTNIMASHEQLLIAGLNLDRARCGRWCKPVDPQFLSIVNRVKPADLEQLRFVWYSSQGCEHGQSNHYNFSRYHMLNLHSFFQHGNVEFRLFQFDAYNPDAPRGQRGGMHAGMVKAYVQLCLAMCWQARNASRASCKALQTDNPRYAMRCWLLRLGFIGPEFATARDIYTRRLAGDTAFRHGRPDSSAEAPQPLRAAV